MDDGQVLHRAFRESPEDSLTKNAYADWLEEQGDTSGLSVGLRWADANGKHPTRRLNNLDNAPPVYVHAWAAVPDPFSLEGFVWVYDSSDATKSIPASFLPEDLYLLLDGNFDCSQETVAVKQGLLEEVVLKRTFLRYLSRIQAYAALGRVLMKKQQEDIAK